MIIPLTKTDSRWTNPELTLSLCGNRLAQFGAPHYGKCNMIVRRKNPKQKGFVKVNLHKGPENGDNYEGWHWRDFLNIWMESVNIFFENTEKYINKMFSGFTSVTVWVKFEKA
jgi:hypothetical protein